MVNYCNNKLVFHHSSLIDFPYRLWLLELTLGLVEIGRQKQVCVPSGYSLTLGQIKHVGKPHPPTESEGGCSCFPLVISEEQVFSRARLLLYDLSNSFLILKIRLQRINGEPRSVVPVMLFIQSHLLLFIKEASCVWSFLHMGVLFAIWLSLQIWRLRSNTGQVVGLK